MLGGSTSDPPGSFSGGRLYIAMQPDVAAAALAAECTDRTGPKLIAFGAFKAASRVSVQSYPANV